MAEPPMENAAATPPTQTTGGPTLMAEEACAGSEVSEQCGQGGTGREKTAETVAAAEVSAQPVAPGPVTPARAERPRYDCSGTSASNSVSTPVKTPIPQGLESGSGLVTPHRPTSTFRPVDPPSAATSAGAFECSICYEGGEAWVLQTCGHSFHKACLSHWRELHHRSCPMCRAALPRGVGLTPVGHVSPEEPAVDVHFGPSRGAVISAAQRARQAVQQRLMMDQRERDRQAAQAPSSRHATRAA